jgi:two-component system sensor histidine kinase BarA
MQPRILLAEDNPINREIAIHFLSTLKCHVIPVEDGAQAVDTYKNDTFDLVFLDVQMPQLSGPEAAQKIREFDSKSKKHTPIIAITAYTMESEIRSFLASGMDDHIAKPLSLEKLREALNKWFPPKA